MTKLTIEHSTNETSWKTIEIGARSRVAIDLAQVAPGTTVTDGVGNFYRIPAPEETS